MSTMFFIQPAVVLLCILIGARVSGVGLGVLDSIGSTILSFGFYLRPTSSPIDVMLMIMVVVFAAAAMQASGGLDYMVKIATRVLHCNPKYTTFTTPAVAYTFTVLTGTDHVAYSILLVIAEVSRHNGIRPSRPLTVAITAPQFAVVTSLIAAIVVACVFMLKPQHIAMADVLKVTVPSTILSIGLARVFVNESGKELKDGPRYQALLKNPNYVKGYIDVEEQKIDVTISPKAELSISILLTVALLVAVTGALSELCPAFEHDGVIKPMGIAYMTEVMMLSASALIILTRKPNDDAITRGSVFHANMRVVITVFDVAWLGDTLMSGYLAEVESTVSHLIESAPQIFAFVLSVLSVLANSQGVTVVTLLPIAIKLGIFAPIIIDTFVAVNGYFFTPNYGPVITPIDFDMTGPIRIGRYIFSHSSMIPGLLSMVFSLAFDSLLVQLYY